MLLPKSFQINRNAYSFLIPLALSQIPILRSISAYLAHFQHISLLNIRAKPVF